MSQSTIVRLFSWYTERNVTEWERVSQPISCCTEWNVNQCILNGSFLNGSDVTLTLTLTPNPNRTTNRNPNRTPNPNLNRNPIQNVWGYILFCVSQKKSA